MSCGFDQYPHANTNECRRGFCQLAYFEAAGEGVAIRDRNRNTAIFEGLDQPRWSLHCFQK